MSEADIDRAVRDQEEINAQNAAANAGATIAQRQWEQKSGGKLIEELSDPDIFKGIDEPLKDIFGPDFGRSHILAQKDDEDIWRDRWLNENEAERIINEHNPGRLCFGPFLALAQGVHDRPEQAHLTRLTTEEKRKTRQTMNNKTSRQSIAKDGKGLTAISEIVTTSKIERQNDETSDDGRLSSIRGRLLG